VFLLVNLGSPQSPKTHDVRRYLRQFLMDGRVIDIPAFPRWLLVNGVIAPFRAPSSAVKYRSIWTDEGSPLIVLTRRLARKLENYSGIPVYYCMRYGAPGPYEVMRQIISDHSQTKEVILFPLYPHYAMSSYETAVEYVKQIWQKNAFPFHLRTIEPYYNHPDYIDALSNSILPWLDEDYDHLLFSYHGIPERHLLKTDPTGHHCLSDDDCCRTPSPAHAFCYRHQVLETTQLVVDHLKLSEDRFSISFQSRLGRDKWLGPATNTVLRQLPQKGVKKLLVVTPAFVSDCLETLEEIRQEGRETFLEAGGEAFSHIPCLNDRDEWVETVFRIVSNKFHF
ncbi:MAG: ferrochelatase, partial [Marinilabiliaceae bacterium]